MRALVWAWVFALAGLSGCAVSTSSVSERPARQDYWQGRLVVMVDSVPPQSWSADFELLGSADQGRLKLTGALGLQLADLVWSSLGVQLQTQGETRRFATLSELSSQMTPHALPVESLFGWLHGQASDVPGWQVQQLSNQQTGTRLLIARRTDPAPAAELRLIWANLEPQAP
jgi:outer membrane lipoprotein LolB